jgi:hypothetical protein
MDITKDIYINTNDNTLHINIELTDFPETFSDSSEEAGFKALHVYNNKSFIDGNPIYVKDYSTNYPHGD